MNTVDLSYWGLAVGLLLMLLPLYYLYKYKTGLVKATVIGTLRMLLQLFLFGFYMKYIFLIDNPFVNVLWVMVMVAVASETAVTRSQVRRGALYIPLFLGFSFTALLIGFYFLIFVIGLGRDVFTARYFIPVMGILLGNMLSVNVISLNTFFSGLGRERQLYYYLLANGATVAEARAPFVKEALVKAFTPCIANMAVMGLVALPGTMIGQILGGSAPDVAIKYQIMIAVITFSASMLSVMLTLRLSSGKIFDSWGRIKDISK
ncbi:MAG TPA: ABC transporter permease [Candidatus Avibacteroides excrementipullorum]|nr:ABC transporter permease [Candidatus Avibacteroides excrementipullorum]